MCGQNKFGAEEVARTSFVQLFRALQPEGAKHPMARHLLRQIERESCRQSGEPDGSGQIGFDQFMEVRSCAVPFCTDSRLPVQYSGAASNRSARSRRNSSLRSLGV